MKKMSKLECSTEKRIAYLGFVENIISRMASNSATIKGWSMGITAAILGIGIIGNNYLASYRWILFACSCLITIIIWFLDTFYLYQEKLYRELYSFVIQTNDESKLNFSLDARYKTIKELTKLNGKKPPCFWSVLKNRTILPFYTAQIIIYFLLFVLPIWIG